MASYWDILLQEQVFNQMRTEKFKEATLKGKCKMIGEIIQQTECSKHQCDSKEPINSLEHSN